MLIDTSLARKTGLSFAQLCDFVNISVFVDFTRWTIVYESLHSIVDRRRFKISICIQYFLKEIIVSHLNFSTVFFSLIVKVLPLIYCW